MRTDFQFQVVSTLPEHEWAFREYCKIANSIAGSSHRGSFNAFHGSELSNWHSILHTGLRSGFVNGVYMAENVGMLYIYLSASHLMPITYIIAFLYQPTYIGHVFTQLYGPRIRWPQLAQFTIFK